jgi:hypothetical protein
MCQSREGVHKASNWFKTMSTIPTTDFGQISFRQLLKVLGLTTWGVGSVAQDATSQIEKDEDLQEMI